MASHREEPRRRDQVDKEGKSRQVNLKVSMDNVKGSRTMVRCLSTQRSRASEIKGFFSDEEALVDKQISVSSGAKIS